MRISDWSSDVCSSDLTGYYEVFNQENVDLVDLKATPIERLTEDGIVSGGQERPFDIIIFATGFDSILGAFNRIAFEGRDGISLIEKWRDGPTTNMGMAVHGLDRKSTRLNSSH